MGGERALVVSPSARLLHRTGIEVERSLATRAGRYVVLVTSGIALATVTGALLGPGIGAALIFVTLLGPPGTFLARRTLRFVRAGFAATGGFRLAKHPLSTTLVGAAEGQWVRVRGHVLPGPTFTSAGGRTRTVLACYLGVLDRLRPSLRATRRWELHGVDFAIAMAGGERVRINVAGARYLDRPAVVPDERFTGRPLATSSSGDSTNENSLEVASVYQEEVVAVGDEVEVLGFLRREVDPDAESGFRGNRPIPVLRARSPWALLIRRPTPVGENPGP
jgi:hypothetical protein